MDLLDNTQGRPVIKQSLSMGLLHPWIVLLFFEIAITFPGGDLMEMNTDQVWQDVLGQLQLQMTRATFDTWLKDTHIVSRNNGTLIVGTKSTFAKDWLENRLKNTINRTVSDIIGRVRARPEQMTEVRPWIRNSPSYPTPMTMATVNFKATEVARP
jgi:hypothetical protein